MPSKVHAQLKIVAKIEMEELPHAVEHLGDHVPHLIGNDDPASVVGCSTPRAAMGALGTRMASPGRRSTGSGALLGNDALLSREVNGDVGDLRFGQRDAKGPIELFGNASGCGKLGREANAIERLVVEKNQAILFDAIERDHKMHYEILEGEHAHVDRMLLERPFDATGDGLHHLGNRFIAERIRANHAFRCDTCKAEAAVELGASNAHAVARTLLKRQVVLTELCLHSFQVLRNALRRHVENLGHARNGHPTVAHEQIIDEIGDALL